MSEELHDFAINEKGEMWNVAKVIDLCFLFKDLSEYEQNRFIVHAVAKYYKNHIPALCQALIKQQNWNDQEEKEIQKRLKKKK